MGRRTGINSAAASKFTNPGMDLDSPPLYPNIEIEGRVEQVNLDIGKVIGCRPQLLSVERHGSH